MSLVAVPTPVTPGEASVVVVRVTNDRPQATAFVLRAVGLADGWIDPPTATEVLPFGASVDVPFVVRLPHGFPISRQLIGLVAEPLSGGEPERCSVELLVGELDGVRVEVRPLEVRGGDNGRFAVHLDNHHPDPAELSIEGLAPERRMRVVFDSDRVVLPGGSSVVVRGRLRGGRPFAGRPRRLPFAVRVGGAAEPVHIEGGFTQSPVLSTNLLRVVAIIAVIGLWVGALAAGLGQITGDDDDDLAGSQTAGEELAEGADGEGVGADGAGAAGGGPAGGADGGAAGDDAAAAEDEAAAATTGTKVGGSVEAAEPGGVAVRVEPVPLSDEDAAKATLVDIPDSATRGKRSGQVPETLDQARTTITDPDGQWAIEGLRSPAYYLITFSKAGYSSRSFVVQATNDEPIALDVILEAGNGSVSGVVIGDNGAPIGGADITVTDGEVTLGVRTASSGGNVGQFVVDGLATPGTFLVTATRAGFGTESTTVDLTGNGSEDGVVLQMSEGVGTLSGRVFRGSEPVSNATVTATNDDGSILRSATTLTDSPVGMYSLPQLPIPGTYLLTVEGSGFATSTQRVELTGSSVVDVELEETSGRVTGTVTVDAIDDTHDGEPVANVGVTLSADGIGFKTTTVDDPLGAYELDGIPPGTYVASFQRFGFRTSTLLVTIGPGQRLVVDGVIEELPPAEVTAESGIHAVLSSTGRLGIPGGTATITNAPPDATFDRTADIDTSSSARTFEFTDLPPGVYRIRIDAELHEVQTISVNVPPRTTVEITPELVPYGSASGTVLSSPSGAALPDATVEFTSNSVTAPPSVQTGADGGWEFVQALPAGQYALTFSHPEHAPLPGQSITMAPGETKPPMTTSLVARQVLHVTVRDIRTNEPLDGARVRLYPGSLAGSEPPTTPVATCGANPCDQTVPVDSPNGTVTFRGIAPGPYTGYATADGRTTGRFQLQAQDRLTDTRTVPLASNTGSDVSGIVQFQFDSDPTRGVAGATVTVSGAYGVDPSTGADIPGSRTVTSGGSGGFVIPYSSLPVRGNASVTVTHPSFDVPVGTQPIVFDPVVDTTPTALNPVRLTPRDNTVSGQVNLNPAPDNGATPVVTVLQKPPYAGTVTAVVETLGSGQFRIRLRDANASTTAVAEVRPGTYRFSVTANDYGTAEVTVEVPVPTFTSGNPTPTNPATFTTTTIDRNGRISVTVTSVIPDEAVPAPQPVSGATVVVTNASGVEVRRATSSGGVANFTGLPPSATYNVTATLTRHRPAAVATFVLDPGENEAVTQQMQSLGAIQGSVRGEDGAGTIALETAVVVRATLDPPDSCSTTTVRCFTGTDPPGASTGYLIEGTAAGPHGLDNGTWSVLPTTTVSGYGAAPPQDALIDPANRVVTANFILPALPGDLFGRVTVTGGASVAGILIEATPLSGGGATQSATTNGQGDYRIENLRHGTYTVRFSGPNVREVSRTVTIEKGVDRELNETLVSRTTTITVLADATYGSANSPQLLAGATVTLFASGSIIAYSQAGVTNPTTTDANGTASFPGLIDGGYRVQITMTGYQTPPTQTVNAEGGFEDVDFHLRSVDRTTSIRIVSSANNTVGIPNIPVTFTPNASPGRPTVSGVVSASTGIATTVLPHGTYTVSIQPAAVPAPPAQPPPLHGTTISPTSLVVTPTDTDVPFAGGDFAIQEARVTVAASVVGGTPTQIRVRLVTGASPSGTVRETRFLPAAGGTAEFYLPASTQVTVVADVEGDASFGADSDTVTSGANGSTTAADALVVRKVGDAGVRVVDRGGDPIADVAVTLDGVTVQTTSSGMAVFTGRTPSTYTATAVEAGYTTNTASVVIAPGQSAGTSSSPDATIILTGDRQTRIVVNNENGNNLNGASVNLAGQTITSAGGRADFSTLDPGTYTLTVTATGYQTHTESVTITPTQTRNDAGNTVVNMVLVPVTTTTSTSTTVAAN